MALSDPELSVDMLLSFLGGILLLDGYMVDKMNGPVVVSDYRLFDRRYVTHVLEFSFGHKAG
jgi:hypothetical protein